MLQQRSCMMMGVVKSIQETALCWGHLTNSEWPQCKAVTYMLLLRTPAVVHSCFAFWDSADWDVTEIWDFTVDMQWTYSTAELWPFPSRLLAEQCWPILLCQQTCLEMPYSVTDHGIILLHNTVANPNTLPCLLTMSLESNPLGKGKKERNRLQKVDRQNIPPTSLRIWRVGFFVCMQMLFSAS